MNKTKQAYKHSLSMILIICFFISGCTVKQSVVSTTKCTAPCWEGIIPGSTTYEDALRILQGVQNVDNDTIFTNGSWSIFTNGISLKFYTGESAGMYIRNNTVIMISFRKPDGILSMEQCMQRFGIPAFIKQSHVLGSGFPLVIGSDADHPWLYAVYPSEGISLGYDMYQEIGPDRIIHLSQILRLPKFSILTAIIMICCLKTE